MPRMYSRVHQQTATACAARGNDSAQAVHSPMSNRYGTWNNRYHPQVEWSRWDRDSFLTGKKAGFATLPTAPTNGQEPTFDCDNQCKVYFRQCGKLLECLPDEA